MSDSLNAKLALGSLALLAMCGRVAMKSGDAVMGVARNADVITTSGRALQNGSDLTAGQRLLQHGDTLVRSGDGLVGHTLDGLGTALDVLDVIELADATRELLFEEAGELDEHAPVGEVQTEEAHPAGVLSRDCELWEPREDGLQPVRCTDRLSRDDEPLAEATWFGLRAHGTRTCDLIIASEQVKMFGTTDPTVRAAWSVHYTPDDTPRCTPVR